MNLFCRAFPGSFAVIFAVAGTWSTVSYATDQSEARPQSGPIVENISAIQSGWCLSKEYLEVLNKSRSPLAASVTIRKRLHDDHVGFDINSEEYRYGFRFFAFSGPRDFFYVDKSGYLITPNPGPPYERVHDFYVHEPSSIQILGNNFVSISFKGRKHVYQCFDQAWSYEYVNLRTLAGEYMDKVGKRYRFTPEGLAIFPDRVFRYRVEIGNYYSDVEKGVDRIFEVDERNVVVRNGKVAVRPIGYKFVGSELRLYKDIMEIGPEDGSEFGPEPFLVLKRKSKLN